MLNKILALKITKLNFKLRKQERSWPKSSVSNKKLKFVMTSKKNNPPKKLTANFHSFEMNQSDESSPKIYICLQLSLIIQIVYWVVVAIELASTTCGWMLAISDLLWNFYIYDWISMISNHLLTWARNNL